MPLKDNTEPLNENNKLEKVSGALSTEEIVSLLSKSNKDFIKESEISSTITNLFKKVTPTILAEKNKEFEEQKNNKSDITRESQSKEIKEEEEKNKVENKNPEEEKKYTEAEAKKLANDYAKQYYNNGYKMGVKKTTEELQKGDKALAVTFKKTTDNIFSVTPDFSSKLNKSINQLISKITTEVLGYEIDNKNDFFQKRIKDLVDSIETSVKDVEIFLNQKDLDAIYNYNKENNISMSFKLQPDSNLERGDLRIKSGSINLGDIVSNKVNFSESNDLDLKFENHNQAINTQPISKEK